MARHRLFVGQDQHKFSVAHMTVFPDGTKEKLHGHNFHVHVTVDLRSIAFADLLDIGVLKHAVVGQCKEWNEHLLVAGRNPFHEVVRHDAAELELRLCGKRYVVPAEDAVVLPIDNVTVENLAVCFAERLVERLGTTLRRDVVEGVEVEVLEIRGQGGTFYWTWPA